VEKYLAALLLTFGVSVNAQTIKGTVPIICADEVTFADTLDQFGEEPVLTALSKRDMGEGFFVPASMVVFLNIKTGTFTIAEKIDNMYCVIAMGENMKPFFDNESNTERKGT
jgi:hypothetical protein